MNHDNSVQTDAVTTGPAAARPRRRWLAGGVIALLVVGSLASIAWQRSQGATKASAAAATQAAKPALELLPQDVATVVAGQVDQTLPLTGTLRPLNRSEVKAPLAGQVASVTVREGDAVRRGQTLATLDTADLQARLRDRQGALEAGQAQLALARKTRANNQALLGQNFISQAAFDNANSGFDAAEATVKSLQAQLEQARKALADAVVSAPIDGVVAQRVAEPGLSVPVNATLLVVHDLSEMELEVLIPTSQIPRVRVGQRVAFTVEGFGGRQFDGEVERISPSAEAGARSIPIFVRVANPTGQLRGGMFAEGTLVVERSAQALVMPQAALRPQDGSVLRLADGHLEARAVKLGAVDASRGLVEVLSGLQAGDRVVLSAAANLRAGLPVRVVTPMALAQPQPAPTAAH